MNESVMQTIPGPQVAVIGCGYWGQNLVRNFQMLGRLGAVCEASLEGQRRARELAPDVEILGDAGAVLDDPRFAGVVIATPAETHAALARRALLAGKDVFVEKPLALRLEDGAEVVRLAQERRLILMVGHLLEYHPAIRQLHALVDRGVLGRIRYLYSHRLNLGKVRREENILWSFAPHDIAVILRLAGEEPFEVLATGGAYLQPNIADVTITQMLFDNGMRAHVFVSWLHPWKEQRLVVIGDGKMASFDDVSKRLVLHDQRVDWHEGLPLPVRGPGRDVAFDATEPLRLECEAFLDVMATRQPPVTDGASGLRVLRVLQAAQRSLIRGGQPVPMPFEAPEFTLPPIPTGVN
jgi:predicted dehydrogenase